MPRLLVFTAKLGYQTRSFDEAARKLGVDLMFVTDRCHQLDDPWGDRAIPVHFESPDAAAYAVLEAVRDQHQNIDGILALGDRPAVAAAYVARGLGILYNHPAAVEACRSKLRMREVFGEAGLRGPWFLPLSVNPAPEPSLLAVSYPCVLKPLSLSASQGVVRANSREEFISASARIRRLLESAEIRATRDSHRTRRAAQFGKWHAPNIGAKTHQLNQVRVQRRNHEAGARNRDNQVDILWNQLRAAQRFFRGLPA